MRRVAYVLIALVLAGCASASGDNGGLAGALRRNIAENHALAEQFVREAQEDYARGLITAEERDARIRDALETEAESDATAEGIAAGAMAPPIIPAVTEPEAAPEPAMSLAPGAPIPMPSPPPGPTPTADICARMSCPTSTAAPSVQYVPVAPGDPLNAGVNSAGFPMR